MTTSPYILRRARVRYLDFGVSRQSAAISNCQARLPRTNRVRVRVDDRLRLRASQGQAMSTGQGLVEHC